MAADNWYHCEVGGNRHRHWGKLGAAGLLLINGDHALMHLRSAKSHGGEVWAVPGGALEPGESALAAALRETAEEAGIELNISDMEMRGAHHFDHGGWRYTTIVASIVSRPEPKVMNSESVAFAWVPVTEIAKLPLYPAFADALPTLLAGPLHSV